MYRIKRNAAKLMAPDFFCVWACLICALFPCLAAAASSLHISPVRIFFEQGQTINSIQIENSSDSTILVQSELVSWAIQDGQPDYQPTDELIISPPIFELRGKQKQTVRFALKDRSAPDIEKTYRVFLTEVPVKDSSAKPKSNGPSIKFSLRIGLPIFVAPQKSIAGLELSLMEDCASNSWTFSAKNTGTVHDRILGFVIKDELDSEELLTSAQTQYILANSTVTWQVKADNVKIPDKMLATIRYFPMRSEQVIISPVRGACAPNSL